MAYLMKEKKICYYEAYDILKKKRKCVEPNDGFDG